MLIIPDVSEFQSVLTMAYRRHAVCIRSRFSPDYPDRNWPVNKARIAALRRVRRLPGGAGVYFVALAGYTPEQQFEALKRDLGATPPEWLTYIMIDVESWSGQSYAMHGDHSVMLNKIANLLAGYIGRKAVWGYGNRNDLANLWPHRPSWLSIIVASYGTQLVYKQVPGAIGQQYTNGRTLTPRIGARVLPVSTPPFGRCDHNVLPDVKDGHALRVLCGREKPSAPPKPAVKPAGNKSRVQWALPHAHYYGASHWRGRAHWGKTEAERVAIKHIQWRLQTLGYLSKAVKADGIYDNELRAAVAKWQHAERPAFTGADKSHYGRINLYDWKALFNV